MKNIMVIRQIKVMPPKTLNFNSTTAPTTTAASDQVSDLMEILKNILKDCFKPNVTHSRLVPGQQYDENGFWCPRIFDGFACWDDTPPNTVAMQNCPSHIFGFDPRLPVYKKCSKNGTWLVYPEVSNTSWTNYTSCVDVDDLNFRTEVNRIYVIGYCWSVAALLISLAIFKYFRSLQCTRIRIHMHLFSSVALNNMLWIVWYKFVVDDINVVRENRIWCQILHIFVNYFMVTSYFWMFCEGLHLHIALVVVFLKDDVAMQWFKGIGWGLSLTNIVVYAVARYFSTNTERCWMETSDTFWIITTPVVISLLLSFVFLVNVVRMLVTKLPATNQNASLAAKKATRAALLLVPLFGLHFLLIPLHPDPGSSFERVYQVVSALMTSLQGLCVSILFCFTNHEVTTAARMQWARIRNRNEEVPMTGVTAGESINTRENLA